MIIHAWHCVIRPKPFNLSEHCRSVRLHPEEHIRMDALIKQMEATAPLRAAKTMRELREAFLEATRAAKGDDDLLGYLTEVKERCKGELKA